MSENLPETISYNDKSSFVFRERTGGFLGLYKGNRKRISFANPEVTDWFVYKFMCSTDAYSESKPVV